MQVKVLFFGLLKDLVGTAEDRVELAEGASVADLLAHYRQRFPRWEQFGPNLAVAVNQEYAGPAASLQAGDEVAFLPPVSGGEAAEHVELTRRPLDTASLASLLKSPADGAVVVFDGIVRAESAGRRTLYLEYEAYEPMALRQMRALLAELRRRFPVDGVVMVHRLGRLAIGDTSVWIGVSAPHRAAAFDACRYAIDALKRTVPIWKKEYFADGAVWVEGERPRSAARVAPPAPATRNS